LARRLGRRAARHARPLSQTQLAGKSPAVLTLPHLCNPA
jgi:hypothetical protein